MKERPILFSAPMVRAILEGRKTQTRRMVKLPRWAEPCNEDHDFELDGDPEQPYAISRKTGCLAAIECPYGEPGGRLWVRETWYCDDYRCQSGPYLEPDGWRDIPGMLVYRADDERPYEAEQPVWRPAIHMPRWASRIQLEVTGVRVEPLQQISEADAIAEGCTSKFAEESPAIDEARVEYRALWESINGAGSWDANPWVWVVEFRDAGSQP